MSESDISTKLPVEQVPRLPKQSLSSIDYLRRDFIRECLDHVSRMSAIASDAIHYGDDNMYEIQIDMMRSTMKQAMVTYKEMIKEGA